MATWPLRMALAALVLTGAGCAATSFRRAVDADTIEAYRAYLRDHPDDENSDAANTRLAELEFDRATRLHTVIAFKRFLEEFPNSPKAADVRALLEAQRFNAAKERGTPEALRQFLRDHPDGAHHEEAEQSLESMRLAQALASNDPAAGGVVLKRLQDPRQRVEAEAKLDEQAFAGAAAQGATGLLTYLKDYPAGSHRQDAQVRLLSLKLDGLLFSDLLEAAQAEQHLSPLGPQVPDWQRKLSQAQADRVLTRSADPAVQATLPSNYLRSMEDLLKSLLAPDSLDRWEAAEELGQWVSVQAIDPLLAALHSARNALVRLRAFDSLAQVLKMLPRPIAEYEVAVRLDALQQRAGAPDVFLEVAALKDLSGHPESALPDYQRAYDPALPDPVVLWRLMQLRRERRQYFSSAVAARQIALWARGVAEGVDTGAPAAQARELCAASEAVRAAAETISGAKTEKTDFPEDLVAFEATAREAQRLVTARLKDAELALETQRPQARQCEDRRWADRTSEALRARLDALRAVRKAAPGAADRVLVWARDHDPSLEARATATQVLGEKRAGR